MNALTTTLLISVVSCIIGIIGFRRYYRTYTHIGMTMSIIGFFCAVVFTLLTISFAIDQSICTKLSKDYDVAHDWDWQLGCRFDYEGTWIDRGLYEDQLAPQRELPVTVR